MNNQEDLNARSRRFESMLRRSFPGIEFPPSLVGDLDDLLFTMKPIVAELRRLSENPADMSAADLRRALYVLEIHIDSDLPMVIADVLPALRQTRESYNQAHEVEDDDLAD